MSPDGLPDRIRWPDPEQHCSRRRSRLADRSPADAPDEDDGDDSQQHGDGTDRNHARGKDCEHGSRQEHLEGAPVGLAPEERGKLTVEHVSRHQPPDGLVTVESAEKRAPHENPFDRPQHQTRDNQSAHRREAHRHRVPGHLTDRPRTVTDNVWHLRHRLVPERGAPGPGRRPARRRRDSPPRAGSRRRAESRSLRARLPPPQRDRPRDRRSARRERDR